MLSIRIVMSNEVITQTIWLRQGIGLIVHDETAFETTD